jgi:hypothetical protein
MVMGMPAILPMTRPFFLDFCFAGCGLVGTPSRRRCFQASVICLPIDPSMPSVRGAFC